MPSRPNNATSTNATSTNANSFQHEKGQGLDFNLHTHLLHEG
jgi:hypothetical protein